MELLPSDAHSSPAPQSASIGQPHKRRRQHTNAFSGRGLRLAMAGSGGEWRGGGRASRGVAGRSDAGLAGRPVARTPLRYPSLALLYLLLFAGCSSTGRLRAAPSPSLCIRQSGVILCPSVENLLIYCRRA